MAKGDTHQQLIDTFNQQLRRGSVILAVLSQLKEEKYGYSLRICLDQKGMEIDEGTLYPLLRRLESQGLLQSDWKIEEVLHQHLRTEITPQHETVCQRRANQHIARVGGFLRRA